MPAPSVTVAVYVEGAPQPLRRFTVTATEAEAFADRLRDAAKRAGSTVVVRVESATV